MAAAAPKEGAQGKEVAAKEEGARTRKSWTSGSQQILVRFFDIFYPRLPPTSNSTFIVFIPGLL